MLLAALVVATSLTYPVADLGGCDSLSSCKTYCDIPWHQTVCTEYGVRQKVLAAVDITYPILELGGCGSKAACKVYCDDSANRPACVDFARRHGVDTSSAASSGRAPSARPGGGLVGLTFPIPELGGCASKGECKAYCDQPQNRQACFNFAYEKGLVGGSKAAEKLSGLKFPIAELGNCGSLSECETYCGQPDHHRTCDAYAKDHGFEPPGGGAAGPGGCSGDEECNAYCSNPAHRDECEASWQEHCAPHPDWPECQKGPPGGGPGGCTNDEECRNYCENNPDDEECRRGREEWCQQNPDECKGFEGPGGCVSENECRLYCEQNPDDAECRRGHEDWCREHPEECRRSEEDSNQCGGMDCTLFCEQNPDSDYCQRANDRWCQDNPEDCAAKEGEWGPGGPGGPRQGLPEGYPDPAECGGMDCEEFCRVNPDADYCVRMDAIFCEQNPGQCASPPGVEGPPEDGGFPSGDSSEDQESPKNF